MSNEKSLDEIQSDFEQMIKDLEKDQKDLKKFSKQNHDMNKAIARGDYEEVKKISGEMEVPSINTSEKQIEVSHHAVDHNSLIIASPIIVIVISVIVLFKIIKMKNKKHHGQNNT